MKFSTTLLRWYAENKRELPWRNTTAPYPIWLSEVILQQTRVAQGMEYYLRFVENFPTIFDLAAAPEDQVMKLWQGLGYYSRARNLHDTAKKIVSDYAGKFPQTAAELQKLKGIGSYSSAAIASFAFNECIPAIDGNVLRLTTRLFGIFDPIDLPKTRKQVDEVLRKLIDKKNPGLFNQAMIEFGALYCKPTSPDCDQCIFTDICYAKRQDKVHLLPTKSTPITIRKRFFYYLLITEEQNILLHKRTARDIWKGLYDFPLIESDNALSEKEIRKSITENMQAWNYDLFQITGIEQEIKHQLTHQSIHVSFIKIQLQDKVPAAPISFQWIQVKEIHNFPVPRLIENYLNS